MDNSEKLHNPIRRAFIEMMHDRSYWSVLLTIGLPVALQNLFSSGLNLVDSVMVGRLGDTSLAAVGIANTVFFLMVVFMFGIGSGIAIFIAQYWGRKDIAGVRMTMAIGVSAGFIVSVFFMIITLLLPTQIMKIFTADKEVIRLGSDFLKIVAFSYPLAAISNVFYSGLRSVKKAALPLWVSAVSIVTNTVLNSLLIYGLAGFPKLGVRGSAIATVIARSLELLLIVSMVYLRKFPIAIRRSDFKAVRVPFLKEILRVTAPVMMNEGLWSLGISTYTVLFAKMGTVYVASYNILQTIDRLAFALTMGMASATAALVGHKIGEGKSRHAYLYAARTNIMGTLLGAFIGVLLFVKSNDIVNLFNVSYQVKENAVLLIRLFSILLPLKTFNLENLLGALRSGGDTRFAFLAEIIPLWFFAIPAAFLGGWKFAWAVPVVYLLTASDEIFKAVVGLKRFVSQKWINEMKSSQEM